MGDREAFRERVEVRPRFRCLVCRRFVLGTEHGTCPRCGWRPPTVSPLAPRPDRARAIWIVIALVALAIVAVTVLGR